MSVGEIRKSLDSSRLSYFVFLTYLFLPDGITSEPAAELLEYLTIYLAEQYGRVNLTASQSRQLFQRFAAALVTLRDHAECHQYFIGVKSGVAGSQIFCLCFLDGFDKALRDEFRLMVNACQVFGGVQQESS